MSSHPEGSILVVEDSEDTRDALRVLLQLEGYRVETAENGQDGLEKLRAGFRPWLILLDLMMPVMDGAQFRREQLADPQLAEIPVVVYSALPPANINVGQLKGVAYLQKPVDFETLLSLVRLHG
jgi:CheY-like chemotaxis protein